MLPDRVSNTGPLAYGSGALPIALRGPAHTKIFITCAGDGFHTTALHNQPPMVKIKSRVVHRSVHGRT